MIIRRSNLESFKKVGRPQVDQALHMQAAVDGVRDGVAIIAMCQQRGLSRTTLQNCYAVVKGAPELIDQVLSGAMTIHKAYQILKQGTMVPCPVCNARGYIFRPHTNSRQAAV